MRSTKILPVLTIALTLVIILAACSNTGTAGPTPTPEPVRLTLSTNPDPPVAGNVQLTFEALDSSGQPVTGADFDVIADHTEMGGMTMHGKATDQGNGRYAISTKFGMAGKWKLTVQVLTSTVNFKKDIVLEVR